MRERKQKTLPRDEAQRIADRMHSAAIQLLRSVRTQDRSLGIGPAQLSALSVLVFGGPRSLKELAEAEQVRPPTMSRIVAGLVGVGLVRRLRTDDKRRLRLEATARGTKILHEGRRRRVDLLAGAMASLTEAELQQADSAVEFLQALIGRLQTPLQAGRR